MKIDLQWLRDLVPGDESVEQMSAGLSLRGLPVESIERVEGRTVLDLEIPANRPDCLSHLGVAREVAAGAGLPLRVPQAEGLVPPAGPQGAVPIAIEAPELCGRYCGLRMEGVRIGPSPEWLAARLRAVGQRPIHNVVDITNYVLQELGHPLHAFDLDRLAGGCIRVREAREGEQLTTLDGVERELRQGQLVIADRENPVALAGVMGGANSEVGEETTRVLLESAWFNPTSVRRAARAHGLATDASYRFERGADPLQAPPALLRAAWLIQALAGGEVVGPLVDVHPRGWQPSRIRLRAERITQLLGVSVPRQLVADLLGRLEFQLEEDDLGWWVSPPSFRADVAQEADLVEEVVRLWGYDRLPERLPEITSNPLPSGARPLRDSVRVRMAALGFREIMTPCFAHPARDVKLALFAPGSPLMVDNPLDEGQAGLRQSLLGGILEALKGNENNFNPDVRLFETGTLFGQGPDGPQERWAVAWGGYGALSPRSWRGEAQPFDYYHLKGVAEELLSRFAPGPTCFEPADQAAFLQPGQGAVVRCGGEVIGVLGQLDDRWGRQLKFRQPVYLAELRLDSLASEGEPFRFRTIPRFPGVDRDVSFVVDSAIPWARIQSGIESLRLPQLAEVKLLDLYRGEGVPDGCHALLVRLLFVDPERTLTDAEADALRTRVARLLEEECGAGLR